mgnify:FL=1
MALSKIVENSLADEAVSSAKLKDFSAAVDLNGVELVLDADADTSITADTDDRIDFKIAGVEHFSFSNSSGDTIIKPMVDAKDIKFQQYDGRTLLDINDGGFIGIANGATGAGAIRIFEDTDNGSNYVGLTAGSISSSLTFTLPTADGSSGQFLKTDGSGALSFDTVSSAADDLSAGDAAINLTTSSGNITIDAAANDSDIIFKGTDNSADITMLTLDGSDAGSATFNHDIILGNDSFVRFGDAGEKITGDGTDLTINSSNDLHLTATTDINIPANVGLTFGDDAEKIEGDGTDLTISGNNINLTATADVVIPNNVGIQFGGASEKIEGDGTDMTISANNLTIDAAADIILDAAGNNITLKSGGTSILDFVNSSSDVIIKPMVDAKDIIFQQYDGTEVARIEDNATFNVVTDKLAINGTAVTATAAEINLIDGGTSRGTTALATGDGLLVNDGGTMRMTNIDTVASYIETLNNRPAFYAFGDGATSIANNSLTRIAVQNERVDLGGCYNNTSSSTTLNSLTAPAYSFTPNVAGLYYFVGAIQLNTTNYNVGLVNNLGSVGGSETYASLVYRKSDTANGMVIVAGFANMNGTGNNVSLTAHQESGGSINTNDSIYTTYFGGFLVAKT